jgi:hypothetical protein
MTREFTDAGDYFEHMEPIKSNIMKNTLSKVSELDPISFTETDV